MGFTLTYCANVHPGADLNTLLLTLGGPVLKVREALRGSAGDPFPVGLWLSARTAQELETSANLDRLRGAIAEGGLRLASVNAFPFSDFQRRAVKREVFRPAWADPERLRYTESAARAAARLAGLPTLALSTLPVGFKPEGGQEVSPDAVRNLARAALSLARLEEETGRRLILALEPEPFGMLESTREAVAFFEGPLASGGGAELARLAVPPGRAEDLLRRHLGVCLDTCHLAVQFEDLAASYALLDRAGILVGKVQVSSALEARSGHMARLKRFDEPRYLHQTVAAYRDGARKAWEDLPGFLADPEARGADRARVHFHVPVDWAGSGGLATTQGELATFLGGLADLTRSGREIPLLEIETYTWSVLPSPPRDEEALAAGIAREFAWVRKQLD